MERTTGRLTSGLGHGESTLTNRRRRRNIQQAQSRHKARHKATEESPQWLSSFLTQSHEWCRVDNCASMLYITGLGRNERGTDNQGRWTMNKKFAMNVSDSSGNELLPLHESDDLEALEEEARKWTSNHPGVWMSLDSETWYEKKSETYVNFFRRDD